MDQCQFGVQSAFIHAMTLGLLAVTLDRSCAASQGLSMASAAGLERTLLMELALPARRALPGRTLTGLAQFVSIALQGATPARACAPPARRVPTTQCLQPPCALPALRAPTRRG